MHVKYSFNKSGDEYAFAQRSDIDASYKDLVEVCASIRGKDVKSAIDLLTRAEKKEFPILYRRFNKKLGHRSELGGKKGRYPVKAVRHVKRVLMNAINNAKVKQLEEDSLFIVHAVANKQKVYPRLAPKGRRMRWDYETSYVEIVLKGKPSQVAEVVLPDKDKPAEDTAKDSSNKDSPKSSSESDKKPVKMKSSSKASKKVNKDSPKKKSSVKTKKKV